MSGARGTCCRVHRPSIAGLCEARSVQSPRFVMNEEESYDELVLEQHVVEADDLVEAEVAPYEDDYQPSQEVILLDMMRVEDEDFLDVA
jgi:hypothetical protein